MNEKVNPITGFNPILQTSEVLRPTVLLRHPGFNHRLLVRLACSRRGFINAPHKKWKSLGTGKWLPGQREHEVEAAACPADPESVD